MNDEKMREQTLRDIEEEQAKEKPDFGYIAYLETYLYEHSYNQYFNQENKVKNQRDYIIEEWVRCSVDPTTVLALSGYWVDTEEELTKEELQGITDNDGGPDDEIEDTRTTELY